VPWLVIRDMLRLIVQRLHENSDLVVLPRRFKPDLWMKLIPLASPRDQAELIERMEMQRVGMTSINLLTLLVAFEPDIQEEPAISVYWRYRSELEQTLSLDEPRN
jgi:hypothetical protein